MVAVLPAEPPQGAAIGARWGRKLAGGVRLKLPALHSPVFREADDLGELLHAVGLLRDPDVKPRPIY